MVIDYYYKKTLNNEHERKTVETTQISTTGF